MLKAIKRMKDKLQQKKQNELHRKYLEIEKAVIQYYKDLDKVNGGVNFPPFVRAISAVNDRIKSNSDIEEVYNNLMKFQRAA